MWSTREDERTEHRFVAGLDTYRSERTDHVQLFDCDLVERRLEQREVEAKPSREKDDIRGSVGRVLR